MDAAGWIEKLVLRRHPEGGLFRESYRAAETVRREHLPPRTGVTFTVSRDALDAPQGR